MKAILLGVGRPGTGHALTYLLKHLAGVLGESPPSETVYTCSVLDKFYIPTRYPDVWAEGIPEDYYTKKEAEEAVRLGTQVVEWVRELRQS